jgi:hypothetical protein
MNPGIIFIPQRSQGMVTRVTSWQTISTYNKIAALYDLHGRSNCTITKSCRANFSGVLAHAMGQNNDDCLPPWQKDRWLLRRRRTPRSVYLLERAWERASRKRISRGVVHQQRKNIRRHSFTRKKVERLLRMIFQPFTGERVIPFIH